MNKHKVGVKSFWFLRFFYSKTVQHAFVLSLWYLVPSEVTKLGPAVSNSFPPRIQLWWPLRFVREHQGTNNKVNEQDDEDWGAQHKGQGKSWGKVQSRVWLSNNNLSVSQNSVPLIIWTWFNYQTTLEELQRCKSMIGKICDGKHFIWFYVIKICKTVRMEKSWAEIPTQIWKQTHHSLS